MSQIKDGTGTGHLAGVNDSNRLDVSASSSPRIYYESRDEENAFGITTPQLTVTSGGERVLYIKNTSSTQNMIITDIRPSWNGGTTNHILALALQLWFGSSAPTANNTASSAGNLNRSSNNTFDLDVEYWDEGAGGMTIAGGAAALNLLLAQGSTRLEIGGAIILGANDTISFQMTAEETGEATMIVRGFMEDK